MSASTTLVTGSAGFIGFHLSQRLLAKGWKVVGLDNINDYYDVNLKLARLKLLQADPNFTFVKLDLMDKQAVDELCRKYSFQFVVNLAAQAGVRYSLINPYAYLESNLTGFLNILEACRHHPPEHLIFASSSSVYGANKTVPFSTSHNVDHPLALYAASKKSNELMAHAYANLFGLPVTGLRFFTVYGPFGRPDMALFLFTKAILEGRPIDVYNFGSMSRDFTYVDDIVEGIVRLIPKAPKPNPNWDAHHPDASTSYAPYQLFNIGSHKPVNLMDFIKVLERKLKKAATLNLLPLQPGDVESTYADISNLEKVIGSLPKTSIEEGIEKFVDWYVSHYGIKANE